MGQQRGRSHDGGRRRRPSWPANGREAALFPGVEGGHGGAELGSPLALVQEFAVPAAIHTLPLTVPIAIKKQDAP